MPNFLGGALRRTKEFIGLTDKYLESAIAGEDVLDVTGTFFSDHQRDFTQNRLANYKRNWKYYNGQHFKNMSIDGKQKLVINLLRPIVNKSVDWLFTHGFKITAPPGNEAVIPLLDIVWNANQRDMMLWEHGQMGAVTGDAYLYVSVEDRDSEGKPLPLDNQRVVIRNLNSAYVHPVYDEVDSREMLACLIQFPTLQNRRFVPSLNQASGRPGGVYSIIITRDTIVEYWNRDEIPNSKRENFLGRVPVVHTRNIAIANSFFGQSDIDDIIPLNESLNSVANNIDDIIAYHAAPTTVIMGARASQLERGANKVWSGLPKDAKVQNLALEGELDASVSHFESIKLAIHELSNTPESSLGKVQQISNTSAAALEVQYLPLIEKTRRKYLTYGSTIAQVNEIVLQILDQRFGIRIGGMVGDKARMFETYIEFKSPLPQDKKLQVDLIAAKLKEGLESKAGALRTLEETDIPRKTLEILMDKRQQLAEDIERAAAAAGVKVPNLSVVNLGSLAGAQPELENVFQAQDDAIAEAFSQDEQDQADKIAAATPPPAPPAPPKAPSGGGQQKA